MRLGMAGGWAVVVPVLYPRSLFQLLKLLTRLGGGVEVVDCIDVDVCDDGDGDDSRCGDGDNDDGRLWRWFS